MKIAQGIQVSIDNGTTWYKLSDHNRTPILISYDIIESARRMANGTLRKYVVARKHKISTDWNNFPSLDSNVVDYSTGGRGAAWMKAFYEANVYQPVLVKLVYARETVPTQNTAPSDGSYVDSLRSSSDTFYAYITNFTYDVEKRMVSAGSNTGIDYTSVKIEFTEI
jgi:hypothetical protein